MAELDTYPAVQDEEEEKKRNPYPGAVGPMPTPTPAPVPAAMPPPEMPQAQYSAPSIGGPGPGGATQPAVPPPPERAKFMGPEPHGIAKVGRILGDMFTGQPARDEARKERAYEGATSEYKEQLGAGEAARKETSEAELKGAQAGEAKARGEAATAGAQNVTMSINGVQYTVPQKDAEKLIGTSLQQKGAGERTTQTNESHETIASGKEKSTEQIATEKAQSNERIATGHNLAMTESARIRASAANDPNKLTNTMKSMKQQAQATLPGIERALDETEKVHGLLGPGAGRWNDFWTGKVGGGDPAYKHYRDEIGMVQSAVTLAHARGRMSNELFEHFEKMFDAGKQSPENMIQALNVAREWLTDYANMGEPGSPVGGGGAATPGAVSPVELERGPDGKLRPKAAKK